MAQYVCLLRAINILGRNKIKMVELREECSSLGFENPRTLLQSGNLVVNSRLRSHAKVSRLLEGAIEERFGFKCPVITRRPTEVESALEGLPYTSAKLNPSHVMLMFLEKNPTKSALETLRQKHVGPEEFELGDRVLYGNYVDGVGRSKLTSHLIERTLEVVGTARNVNTVKKLIDLAAG